MFQNWIHPFRLEASGESAMNHLRTISQHHRIQASPGYRAAAKYCVEQLHSYGLDAELVAYPADPSVYFGNWRSFREWHCREAELTLLAPHPQRLARYTEMELSVIQRSTSTPPEGITAELVPVANAEDESSYAGLDLQGKMVLATGAPTRIFDLAVRQFGAAGLVLDNMNAFPPLRSREDLYDAVQYTSFWWHDEEETGFGFCVSPRVGDRLRKLCAQGPVQVQARVDADLYTGEMENVEAFIPGETDEEVLLISHLCHPKPGANDNASGPSTLLETARILSRLIREGKVAKPKRGIRFLMMPEMTGTHAYVQAYPERLQKTVAALNLDMVGADQRKSGGPLTVEKPTRALPSYVAELAYGIFTEVAEDVQNLSKSFGYSLTNHVMTPFSGGSDHYILADPSVGIPCPMIITWPDKYYHTSADTPENIDPQLMEKVATTAATYLYWVSNAEERDMMALVVKMMAGTAGEMERVVGRYLDGGITAEQGERLLAFIRQQQVEDMISLKRLLPEGERESWADRIAPQRAALERSRAFHLSQLHAFAGMEAQGEAVQETVVPDAEVQVEADPLLSERITRRHPGPIALGGFLGGLTPEEREDWHQACLRCPENGLLQTVLQYWMNGENTVQDLIDLVELETGVKDTAFTLAYMRLLKRLELVC